MLGSQALCGRHRTKTKSVFLTINRNITLVHCLAILWVLDGTTRLSWPPAQRRTGRRRNLLLRLFPRDQGGRAHVRPREESESLGGGLPGALSLRGPEWGDGLTASALGAATWKMAPAGRTVREKEHPAGGGGAPRTGSLATFPPCNAETSALLPPGAFPGPWRVPVSSPRGNQGHADLTLHPR